MKNLKTTVTTTKPTTKPTTKSIDVKTWLNFFKTHSMNSHYTLLGMKAVLKKKELSSDAKLDIISTLIDMYEKWCEEHGGEPYLVFQMVVAMIGKDTPNFKLENVQLDKIGFRITKKC